MNNPNVGIKFVTVAGLIVILTLALVSPAAALTVSGEMVLMVDGSGDSDVSVQVAMMDFTPGYEFGYMQGGTFVPVVMSGATFGATSFAGGSLVDFAIRDGATGTIEMASAGSATMEFTGLIPAAQSQNPEVAFDYFQNLTITWDMGNNDIVANFYGRYDGFAPASSASVPEPAGIMFFLGPTLIGLGLLGRKRRVK